MVSVMPTILFGTGIRCEEGTCLVSRYLMGTIPDLRQYGGANVYLAKCPSRTVLETLSNKWSTLVMGALSQGPLRFGQLRRTLDGITQKMLTQTLRTLERDGLISRTVYPTIPPRVEYAHTELGRDAGALFHAIRDWAERHSEAIVSAREVYDERAGREPRPVG
jgi:DNA-binding HxlR family transcriptional regulator